MSIHYRIQKVADEVKAAGLAGEDMTQALLKAAQRNDLTANEIKLAGQKANREVQLELFKTAEDKRFTFKRAEVAEVVKQAQKTASVKPVVDHTEDDVKLAAIDEAGGDPFRAPSRYDVEKLSLMGEKISARHAFERDDTGDRELLQKMAVAREEVQSLLNAGKRKIAMSMNNAAGHHKQLIQSAIDLVIHGITLPSLYEAVIAGVSGSRAEMSKDQEIRHADQVMSLVIQGLKDRGIPNHKMGFRDRGDINALDKLTTKDLLALCKCCSSYVDPQDLEMFNDVKEAQQKLADVYSEYRHEGKPSVGETPPGRPWQAEELLNKRPSAAGPPQAYLDDIVTSNTPGGAPRVYDTNNEFVVAVKDLVGEQFRLRKCYAAQEYLGLKLKQIEEAMTKLRGARQKNAELLELKEQEEAALAEKVGVAPLVAGALKAAPYVMTAMSMLPSGGGAKAQPKAPKKPSVGVQL